MHEPSDASFLINARAPVAGQPLRIALLGYGTVGSSLAELIAAQGRTDLIITRVFNRNVARRQGSERARFVPSTAIWTENVEEVLTTSDVDVVVELMGGLDPIGGWLEQALTAGKHVVTANKQLIAVRGPELFALAAKHGGQLLYGAAVAGGVPVIPGIAYGLTGDRLRKLSGIVNGTCNFILSSMEGGAEYADVLAKAQAAGYAEADPSADVDGFDARAKLCLLARLALGVEIHPEQVPTLSITRVSALDFAYARELGATVRQISRAELQGSGVFATVAPMLVPLTSPLALSRGTQNTVVTTGEFGGDVVFSGHGAGGHPTAVAVLSDILAVAADSHPVPSEARKLPVTGDPIAPHYLRFVVRDRPGIVAAIAGALSEAHVNIDAVLQHRGHAEDRLPFVITTERCFASQLAQAVEALGRMDFMVEPPLVLEILVADDPAID